MSTLNQLFELLNNHAEESRVRSASYALIKQGVSKIKVIEVLEHFSAYNVLSEGYENSLFNVMSDIEKYC